MRISDWSSDVCSSDLPVMFLRAMAGAQAHVALDPAVIDWMWWIFNEAGARAHDSLIDLARVDLREAVTRITPPTLVIGGRHDPRSEERRVGKEWGSTCRSRGSPDQYKQKTSTT